ncbi:MULTISPECIES: LysM peptidoglycan-binding domain-containing protein [Paenibacillus]|uniref:LysM peptidoglycan-binding domain-containing protein n=1 Tax=Paenibacillus TaxID=44249 RepID=UPI000CF8E572|nr:MULTISPECIES: LysM peptidoglycan-binding domain-containing protein [Paenibacillus]MBJ9987399.1 LysM peptidoglycan-binding domain-containing protein [Paenibacillus sp. S28]PQP89049.1 peptidoglycan-binding protein [Paenibacillus sp. AR247]
MASLEFWLKTMDETEWLQLPVNPEQISVKTSHGYEDVQVTQLGEYTVIGEALLKEYSLASFFPRDYHPGFCEYEDIHDPWETVEMIEKWIKSRRPVRLDITGTKIKGLVTIRSFQYTERAGNPGDVFYELELKEYAEVRFRQVETTGSGQATIISGEQRPDARVRPAAYVVVPGDTLWKISQRTLGNGDRWREIYAANETVIGKNPNRIVPGQKLVIPS